MKKVLVLIAISLFYWLSCTKTPVDMANLCVRTYDTLIVSDNFIETDTLSLFKNEKTLDFTLRIINIARQSGDCEVIPLCNNFMTITNRTYKTVTIFYNVVGGTNVMIRPYESKYEVVPTGAIPGSNGACFTVQDLKKSMKVRYN